MKKDFVINCRKKLITDNSKLKKSESIVYNTQKPNG